ncbi:MAG: hypothetical protein ACTSO6_08595 [Promethearchaeota archaeon]
MGKGIGITAIVLFVFSTIISAVIAFEIGGNDLEIAIIVLVEGIFFNLTAFLIPGILVLVGRPLGKVAWFYAVVPLTLACFSIFTIVIAALFPTTFIINFQDYFGTGITICIVLSIISLCASYQKLH